MISTYTNNYSQYFQDQMERFQSFEGDLYLEGIQKTVDYVFPDKKYKGKCLDVCSGDGSTSRCLRDKGFDVIGYDGNPQKVFKAVNEVKDVTFFCDDIRHMKLYFLGDRFDLIYASHAFEHFLDPLTILKDCKQLLTPKGVIVLILPYPNVESEGHPGSGLLKLDGTLAEVMLNLQMELEFRDVQIEKVNIREPEIIVKLSE